MAIIKCKMCGGDVELSADKTFGTCEFCGSAMTFPKVEDEQRAAAFNRGNHFRRIGEFDKALAVYERIVREDENDAEAHWCCALCRFGIEYVEDPTTYEWLPTCHRASFDSFLEDVDYLAALEHSDGITRRQYQKDAAKIAEVQRGILATSQNAEPYDIFICYKETDPNGERTKDSALAQDIYYQLSEQGHRVFFSRITLEDVVGTQYEPYIFAALNSAKVMIVVGTKPEYLNAVWVKNEWSRFLAMMRKDRSKLLLPCYRDMDPYDLPEALSVLQSYDMSKIGFIQDLTRGINKVLGAEKKPEIRETVVVQHQAPANNTAALLKRGAMALEDRDWAKADSFYEEVLNQDAENAEAYVGKALASLHCCNLDHLVAARIANYEKAKPETLTILANNERRARGIKTYTVPRYLDPETVGKLYDYDLNYYSFINDRKRQRAEEERFWKEHRLLARAQKFAQGSYAEALTQARQTVLARLDQRVQESVQNKEKALSTLRANYAAHLDQADRAAAELRDKVCDAEYQKVGWTLSRVPDERALTAAAETLEALGDYKDAPQLAAECRAKAAAMREEAKRRAAALAEEQRKLKLQAARLAEKKRKRRTIILSAIALLVLAIVVFIIILTSVILPKQDYEAATALYNEGKYEEAMLAFETLYEKKHYKDADDQAANAYAALQAERRTEAEACLAQGDYIGAAVAYIRAGDPVTAQEIFDFNDIFMAQNYTTVGIRQDGMVLCRSNENFELTATEEDGGSKELAGIVKLLPATEGVNGLTKSGQLRTHRIVSSWDELYGIGCIENAQGRIGIVDVIDGYCSEEPYDGDYILSLTSDGRVVGDFETGSCFTGLENLRNIVDIQMANNMLVCLDQEGKVHLLPEYGSKFTDWDVSHWPAVRKVVAVGNYLFGLTYDSTVVTYGYANVNVTKATDVADIVYADGVILLHTDGTVSRYSASSDDVLKDVSKWTHIAKLHKVSDEYVMGIRYDGTVCVAGSQVNMHYSSDLELAEAWTDVVEIFHFSDYAGDDYFYWAAGLRSDGTLVTTGSIWIDSEYNSDTEKVNYNKKDGSYGLIADWDLWDDDTTGYLPPLSDLDSNVKDDAYVTALARETIGTSLSKAYALLSGMELTNEELQTMWTLCNNYARYCGEFTFVDSWRGLTSDFYWDGTDLYWVCTPDYESSFTSSYIDHVYFAEPVKVKNATAQEVVHTSQYYAAVVSFADGMIYYSEGYYTDETLTKLRSSISFTAEKD